MAKREEEVEEGEEKKKIEIEKTWRIYFLSATKACRDIHTLHGTCRL